MFISKRKVIFNSKMRKNWDKKQKFNCVNNNSVVEHRWTMDILCANEDDTFRWPLTDFFVKSYLK